MSVQNTVSRTRKISAGRSETDISRRQRRDMPRQGVHDGWPMSPPPIRRKLVQPCALDPGRWCDRVADSMVGSWWFVLIVLAYPTARERNVGWQRGHQKRFRPTSLSGAHRGAADQARLPGTSVDVDLSAVVVDPRRTTHRLRGVLGVHRVDAARCGHPPASARRGPPTSPGTGRPAASGRAAAGGSGAGTGPRRGRRCRHRRTPPGPAAGRRSAGGCAGSAPRPRIGSASARSGSGPSAASTAVRCSPADELALGGAAEVGVRRARSGGAAGPGRPGGRAGAG